MIFFFFLQFPKIFGSINFEVELGVVIGKTCKDVSPEAAMDYVAGYCLTLDMTAMEPIIEAREKGFIIFSENLQRHLINCNDCL
jgi:2-keto-4-pentenoate hydratase/2-oxohepta-3-ene-1,7-dioic acid hydratase in catechol pathway